MVDHHFVSKLTGYPVLSCGPGFVLLAHEPKIVNHLGDLRMAGKNGLAQPRVGLCMHREAPCPSDSQPSCPVGWDLGLGEGWRFVEHLVAVRTDVYVIAQEKEVTKLSTRHKTDFF